MSLRSAIILSISALALGVPQSGNGNSNGEITVGNGQNQGNDPSGSAQAGSSGGAIFSGGSCPDGWSESQGNNGDENHYCCPGSSYISGSFEGCVVGTTTVAFTMAGYTSIVSSLAAAESRDASMSDGSMIMTSSSSEQTTMAGESMSMSMSSGASGAQASETSSAKSGNGAAMVTAAPMLGAAALAMLAL